MYASKSFCNIKALISNQPGIIAPAGEISPAARTFSREVGYYSDAAKPGLQVVNFKCVSNQVQPGPGGIDGPSLAKVMDGFVVSQVVGLTDFCYQRAVNTTGQIFADELLVLLRDYAPTVNATNVTIGQVQSHNGLWLPEWIKWENTYTPNATPPEQSDHQVWLVNQSFVEQYSDYEIIVVPPLDNLDLFFTTGANVANLINAITIPQTMERIQLARSDNPETILRSNDYDYINPLDNTQRVRVNWPVLIHGNAGDNIDAIKEAMIEYILANSTRNRQDWTRIFPDIFKRTEFICAPGWQFYAIPNATLREGVYSPITNPSDAIAYIKQVANEYPAAHVEEHTTVLGFPYRSVSIVSIGGTDNRQNKFRIDEIFPDYINVSTSSNEFNRMSLDTQNWVSMMERLVITAESMTETTTMPQGMMKMKRSGILYAVKTYQNIQYLVASKRSVYQLLGIPLN
jgi:hypothetical protein